MAEKSTGESVPQLEVIEKQLVCEGYESVRKTAGDVIVLSGLCPLLKSNFRPHRSPVLLVSNNLLCLEGPWLIRKGIVELQLCVVFPRSYPTRSPAVKVTVLRLPPNISLRCLGIDKDGTLKISGGSSIFIALKDLEIRACHLTNMPLANRGSTSSFFGEPTTPETKKQELREEMAEESCRYGSQCYRKMEALGRRFRSNPDEFQLTATDVQEYNIHDRDTVLIQLQILHANQDDRRSTTFSTSTPQTQSPEKSSNPMDEEKREQGNNGIPRQLQQETEHFIPRPASASASLGGNNSPTFPQLVVKQQTLPSSSTPAVVPHGGQPISPGAQSRVMPKMPKVVKSVSSSSVLQAPYSPTAYASQAPPLVRADETPGAGLQGGQLVQMAEPSPKENVLEGHQQSQASVVRQKPTIQSQTSMSGTQASGPTATQSPGIPSAMLQPKGLNLGQLRPSTASNSALTSPPWTSGGTQQIEDNNHAKHDAREETDEKRQKKMAGDQAGEETKRNSVANSLDIKLVKTDSSFKGLPHKSEQWSANNPDGKLQYKREFLLQLQRDPLSLKKPEAMPTNMEIIKDKVLRRAIDSASNMSDITLKNSESQQRDKSNKIADIKPVHMPSVTSEINKHSNINLFPAFPEGNKTSQKKEHPTPFNEGKPVITLENKEIATLPLFSHSSHQEETTSQHGSQENLIDGDMKSTTSENLMPSPENDCDNSLKIPAMKGATKKKDPQGLQKARVAYVNGERGFGKLRPEGDSTRSIFFHVSSVVNSLNQKVELREGAKVFYEKETGTHEKPKTELVFINSECLLDKEINPKSGQSWLRGEIVSARDDFHFIRPEEPLPSAYNTKKDVFMRANILSDHVVRLECGDLVEFRLGARNKEKPVARSVNVINYKPRTTEILKSYMTEVSESVKSSQQAVLELLSATSLWKLLEHRVHGQKESDYLLMLLELIETILSNTGVYQNAAKEFVTHISKLPMFHPNGPLSSAIKVMDSDGFPRICSALLAIVRFAPSFLASCVHLLEEMGKRWHSPQMHVWTLTFLKTSLSNQPNMEGPGSWRNLPLVPGAEELMGTPMESAENLSEVKTDRPYSSSEEYMDTYYRLLRTECFSAIQDGIKKMLAGELDERDMKVYENVALRGFSLTRSSFNIAIQFAVLTPVKNWERSTNFMYGNLLCISPSGSFKDPIWATVAEKDTKLLNEQQIIQLQLCPEFNVGSSSDILLRLTMSNGSAVMVESPLYFHSIRPVLHSLQKFQMESFSLQKEVVNCRESLDPPEYLLVDSTFNASSIFPSSVCSRAMMTIDDLVDNIGSSTLDGSQQKSLIHALQSRLSIIQGPPGCGKTFVGTLLVRLLLSLKPRPKLPILLLTYKNHALDEFLKGSLKFLQPSEIARVGGRSKEPMLDACNLRQLRNTSIQSKSLQNELNKVFAAKESLNEELESRLLELGESASLTYADIVEVLTEEQLEAWLLNTPFSQKQKQGKLRKEGVFALIKKIQSKNQSLKAFLQNREVKDNNKDDIMDIFKEVVRVWIPPKDTLRDLKEVQDQYLGEIKKRQEEAQSEERNGADSQEEEEFDEEAIEAIQEGRLAAMNTSRKSNEKKSRIHFFQPANNVVICLEDFPSNLEPSPAVIGRTDLWSLNSGQRILFLFTLLHQKVDELKIEVQDRLNEMERLFEKETELQGLQDASILQSKKLVGMTITGASINSQMVQSLRPSIVIVEEAGEVLEPDLLAALTPGLQHLILIGDHKQLRPSVDTYKLRTKYKFDLSMMERLINNKFPYSTLNVQNRMRPEFSKLLLDIYPGLQDNLERVSKNLPLMCIAKPMFFWSHSARETFGRSHTNKEEVMRVTQLALFMLENKVKPSDITVLAAYQGQATLIRKEFKRLSQIKPHLFQGQDEHSSISTNTIDMFQGDENKHIIVSLVRSNPEGKLGFLAEPNRRCVAQSRAQCGMYFVGNQETLSSRSSPWTGVIRGMAEKGCVATSLPLQCRKHRDKSIKNVKNGTELEKIVENPSTVCKLPCGEKFPCNIHSCAKPCLSNHSHATCMTMVKFKFPREKCSPQHENQKRCHEDATKLKCETVVPVNFSKCGHNGTKLCHQKETEVKCKEKVTFVFSKCSHKIQVKCHQAQQYRLTPPNCTETVPFTFRKCGHKILVECYQAQLFQVNPPNCKQTVSFPFPKCGHTVQEQCYQAQLFQVNPPNCKQMVSYSFPKCGHKASTKKVCSDPILDKCTQRVPFVKQECKHNATRECHQKESDITCQEKTTYVFPGCGHSSQKRKVCSEPMTWHCDECDKARKARIKDLEEKLKASDGFKRTAVDKDKDKAEYFKIEDSVLRSIVPVHNWNPVITKIEKVTNWKLDKKYEEARGKLKGAYEDTKFHGTGDDGVVGITKNGFRLPKDPGMYGAGIYFATDSSKSAQEIYTKGSNKLLVCKVLLGKSMNVSGANKGLNLPALRSRGYDSVFAPRNSKNTNGVMNDEFIIYDPDQAKVEYIVHYTLGGPRLPASLSSAPSVFAKKTITSAELRMLKPSDAFFMAAWHADSHFHKMANRAKLTAQVKSITVIQNAKLQAAFESKRKDFTAKGIPADFIYAFHGTKNDSTVMDSILKNNFDMKYAQRQLHGPGHYFSEFPDVSLGYGPGLIFCQLLSGKEYKGGNLSWPGFNSKVTPYSVSIRFYKFSKVVQPAAGTGHSQMVIIEDSDQILPICVINL